MDLLREIKRLCKLYNIQPIRSRGQNFLIKEEVYEKIIKVAELKRDETVLEVGPGLGFLTIRLAEVVKKVIAVELDDRLAEVLQTDLIAQGIRNVEVINEDVLQIKSEKLKVKNYKVVANLPYNITSHFLRKFLSSENKPEMMVLMLQKEVAERIIAQPPRMSLLAVSVQFYARSEIIEIVPADYFWPKPKVDSAIIRLTPRPSLLSKERGSEKNFFRLVKIGFSARRKMLKNNLAAGYHIIPAEAEKKIKKAGFNPKSRAQDLSIRDWIKLFGEFN